MHDPGIWIGALKPRMLRLTGRLADGWLPSLGRVEPSDLAGMNQVIDEAAVKAGRSPQAVRRMLNVFTGHAVMRGPSSAQAERLAGLALDHGVSTFILGSDDADEISRFALEVAPAVRDLVDAAHATALRRRCSSVVEEVALATVSKPPSAHPTSPAPPPTTASACRRSCRGTRPTARRTPARTTRRTNPTTRPSPSTCSTSTTTCAAS